MGLVSDITKERIRERTDMVQLIGEYVTLEQRRVGDFWGRCPFHDEKSASFHVLPDRGLFKCFGCGKAGDVFRFVEEIEGVGFGDALRRLGEKAGVEVEAASPADRARSERRKVLLRASELVASGDVAHRRLYFEPAGSDALPSTRKTALGSPRNV